MELLLNLIMLPKDFQRYFWQMKDEFVIHLTSLLWNQIAAFFRHVNSGLERSSKCTKRSSLSQKIK